MAASAQGAITAQVACVLALSLSSSVRATTVAVDVDIGAARPPSSPHTQHAAASACPATLHPIAQLGGGTGALAVSGDVAYLAIGRRIEVIDLRPEAGVPTPDGVELPAITTLTLGDDIDHLAVSGSTLVAGLQSAREVWVYDVGDPRAPVLRGRVSLPGEVEGVVIHGDRAFVGVPRHLLTVDLYPAASIAVSRDTQLPLYASFGSMTMCGNLLFTVGGGIEASTGRFVRGLQLIDLGDPTAPRDLGAAEMMAGIYGLAIADDVAYVASSSSGLQTFDIADPLHPRRLGTSETPRYGVQEVVADGRTAYGTAAYGLLYVYDVREPAQPTFVKSVNLPSTGPELLHLAGDRLVIASDGALHVLDVGDPTQPRLVGAHHTLGRATPAIAARGGRVFVGTSEGLQVVDVADPLAPRLRGHALLPEQPEAVVLDGDRAYVASGSFIDPGTVSAIDVGQPDAPVRLGFARTAGGLVSLAARSNRAWVTSIVSDFPGPWEHARLQAFDFGEPALPRTSGPFERPGALAFVDDLLYVFDGTALRVLDVAAADEPRVVTAVPFPEPIDTTVLVGRHLYAGGYHDLFVFDVTDARSPTLIDPPLHDIGTAAMGVDGDCLFGLHEGSGQDRRIDFVDMSSPAAPRLVGHFGAAEGLPRTVGMTAGGGRVYLAAESDGLVLLAPEAPPTPTGPMSMRVYLPLARR